LLFQKVKQIKLTEFIDDRCNKLKSHQFTYNSWRREVITVAVMSTTLTSVMIEDRSVDLASFVGTFESHLEDNIQEC